MRICPFILVVNVRKILMASTVKDGMSRAIASHAIMVERVHSTPKNLMLSASANLGLLGTAARISQ